MAISYPSWLIVNTILTKGARLKRGEYMTVRVLIVDEHRLVREGIRVLLKCYAKIIVVGETSTGTHAIAMARRVKLDHVFLDWLIPAIDGVAISSIIHHELHQTGVLVL